MCYLLIVLYDQCCLLCLSEFSLHNIFAVHDFIEFLFSAIAHLDKVKVWGKNIRVTQSKHALVQMPKEGQPVSRLYHAVCYSIKSIYQITNIEYRLYELCHANILVVKNRKVFAWSASCLQSFWRHANTREHCKLPKLVPDSHRDNHT